ncbi:hypothetical protein ACFVWR_15910 [Leifsonia sp. NPDC058292]|uniref:hypothetical protein n=1 Tax=Leifsonia sp. NPDC058292 TaxID=3346428 RepID=UPI0036D8DBFC
MESGVYTQQITFASTPEAGRIQIVEGGLAANSRLMSDEFGGIGGCSRRRPEQK